MLMEEFNTYNNLKFHTYNNLKFNTFNNLLKLFNKYQLNHSTNHTEENHNSNIFHSKENIKIMNKLLKLNTSQYKKLTLIMKLFKELNKFQSLDNILIITLLNIKLNMFHKYHIPLLLIKYQYKDLMLNKFQYKELLLNMFQKPDKSLNMFLNQDKLKM